MKIGILGPGGTFSEEAAIKFSKKPELLLCNNIEEIFDAVLKDEVELGIVPDSH